MTWYRFYNKYMMAPVTYIHNRWVMPSHKVVIDHPDFSVGHYHDVDFIMLYAIFQLVVDFVEVECASSAWSIGIRFETTGQIWNRRLRELPGIHWFVPPARNARRGLHHLRWAMHLKDHPSQSEFAKDIFRLYKFWKHERPARKDPFDSYHLKREGKEWLGSFSEEEGRLLDEANELEMKYEQEDQEMLHLIVKHRLGLWT